MRNTKGGLAIPDNTVGIANVAARDIHSLGINGIILPLPNQESLRALLSQYCCLELATHFYPSL